ncbi:MAG: hypothetical protein M3544_01230, partial [Pseudomonadota bacterium]|nr:hypothetical protein [Pseudomonadota bacterium]
MIVSPGISRDSAKVRPNTLFRMCADVQKRRGALSMLAQSPMNWNPKEGDWKQITDNVKRRWGKL